MAVAETRMGTSGGIMSISELSSHESGDHQIWKRCDELAAQVNIVLDCERFFEFAGVMGSKIHGDSRGAKQER